MRLQIVESLGRSWQNLPEGTRARVKTGAEIIYGLQYVGASGAMGFGRGRLQDIGSCIFLANLAVASLVPVVIVGRRLVRGLVSREKS